MWGVILKLTAREDDVSQSSPLRRVVSVAREKPGHGPPGERAKQSLEVHRVTHSNVSEYPDPGIGRAVPR